MMLAMVFPLYSVTNFLEYTGLRTTDETHDVKVYLLPFAFIAQTATIWVTVLVAFNRYIAVCQPFKAARLCTVVQVGCQRYFSKTSRQPATNKLSLAPFYGQL